MPTPHERLPWELLEPVFGSVNDEERAAVTAAFSVATLNPGEARCVRTTPPRRSVWSRAGS